VDARAADWRRCESVRRTARRFRPRVGMEDVPARASTADVVWDVADWDTVGSEESKRSFAGWGITPPGNDADRPIGSSLHSGHISDPFP